MSYGLIRRLSAAARSVVVDQPRTRHRPLRLGEVAQHWAVLDIDGRRVGRVDSVDAEAGRLVVAGGLMHGHAVVPADRIGELDDGTVRLTLRSAEIAWRRGPVAFR